MDSEKPTASKTKNTKNTSVAETTAKSTSPTSAAAKSTIKPTANVAATKTKPASANKPKSHVTMTDIQKPKPGQAVAITPKVAKKSVKRKKRPTAQLRAGKRIQALPSDTKKVTASTKPLHHPAYKEVTLGELKQPVKAANTKAAPTKRPEQIQKAEVISEGSLPVSKTPPKKMHLSFFRKIHLRPSQIVAGAVVLLLAIFFGRVAIWEHFYLVRMEGSERHTTGDSSISADNPIIEEEEWSDERKDAYEVPADKPRFLSIPSIGVYRSPIMQVGVNSRGEMATPPYLYNVGWYTGSSLPGTNGVSVIDGHGGPYSNAVFEKLPSLAVGAEIIVEMGDGRKFNYYVADLANKPIGDEANDYMNTAFRSPERGRGSLTLITCTGDWVVRDNIRTYSHRLFVRALLDPSQAAKAPSVQNPVTSIPTINTTDTVRPNTPTPPSTDPEQPGDDQNPDNNEDPDPEQPGDDQNPEKPENPGGNSGNEGNNPENPGESGGDNPGTNPGGTTENPSGGSTGGNTENPSGNPDPTPAPETPAPEAPANVE